MRRSGSLVMILALVPISLAAQRSPAGAELPALSRLAPALGEARPGLIGPRVALAAVNRTTGAFLLETPPFPWAQQDSANQLYREARAALNRGRYNAAAELFGRIYSKYPRSNYAGDAYYWQAFAYYKRGNDQSLRQALEVLNLQREKSPNASTRRDARILATRIQGELARTGNEDAAAAIASTAAVAATPAVPSPRSVPATAGKQRRSSDRCESTDDIQTAALDALQQMDESRALPILKKVLARRDEGSLCLRRRAVFLISQQRGPETERILLEAARSDPDPEVREQSVFWLSQVESPEAVAALDSILRSAGDPVLQDKAIFALSQQNSPRARQALRDFALRAGVSDELREKAIFWIGQSDDPDRLEFLKTLYGQLKNPALREKILFSVSQTEGKESQRWLLQVAGDPNETIETRKKALFWLGQSNFAAAELFSLYEKIPNREMKEQLIFVYSQRDQPGAVDKLMQIARSEPDRELRKKAMFWLGQSNDPRVAEFLASLLEKP